MKRVLAPVAEKMRDNRAAFPLDNRLSERVIALQNERRGVTVMPVVLKVTLGPHSGQEYQIDRPDTFTVGRSTHAQFAMTEDLVLSRKHFQVENKPPLCHLIDLGSTNGTKVNGLRVTHVALREGDVITAGDSTFVVHFMEDSKDTQDFAGCAGCGGRIPIGQRGDLERPTRSFCPTAQRSVWLCEECQARRLKFPKTAADYLIEEWIGGGGMGEVFRARQLSQNRPVAIKMMSTNSAIGDKGQQLFRREIEVLRDLLDAGRPIPPQHRKLLRNLRS